MKEERNVNKELVFTIVDGEKIKCKNCVFREREAAGNRKGYERSVCECYRGCKPFEVMYKGAECEYYVGEFEN